MKVLFSEEGRVLGITNVHSIRLYLQALDPLEQFLIHLILRFPEKPMACIEFAVCDIGAGLAETLQLKIGARNKVVLSATEECRLCYNDIFGRDAYKKSTRTQISGKAILGTFVILCIEARGQDLVPVEGTGHPSIEEFLLVELPLLEKSSLDGNTGSASGRQTSAVR